MSPSFSSLSSSIDDGGGGGGGGGNMRVKRGSSTGGINVGAIDVVVVSGSTRGGGGGGKGGGFGNDKRGRPRFGFGGNGDIIILLLLLVGCKSDGGDDDGGGCNCGDGIREKVRVIDHAGDGVGGNKNGTLNASFDRLVSAIRANMSSKLVSGMNDDGGEKNVVADDNDVSLVGVHRDGIGKGNCRAALLGSDVNARKMLGNR